MQDIISKNEIQKHLVNTSLPIFTFDTIDSTNSYAKKLSEDFALVVADSQTLGRGRLGRSFFSPAHSGVYMSLRVHIADLYENVPFITTLSSVAVHKAVKKLYNIDCGIKWVNDILLDGKKLAGILCEICDSTHAVIGIGINFAPSAMPQEIKDIVTHLPENCNVTRSMLIAEITKNLLDAVCCLPSYDFMEYYKAYSVVIGRHVLCTRGNESFSGLCTAITDSGALVVNTSKGDVYLSSGEITLRVTD